MLALRPTPNLEDQSLELMSPWGRVARLYSQSEDWNDWNMSSEWKIPAYQKIVFNVKPEGRCWVGRPRLRWLDDVEADIKALGIKDEELEHKIEKSGRQF
jgi:hypothetical protein